MKNENPIQFVALDKSTADIISDIEEETYPDYMQHWRSIDVLEEPLRSAGVERYSFVAKRSTWVGFCVAFEENPHRESPNEERRLYICDMAVLPDEQKYGYGTLMAMETMRRATENGINRINFFAREKTTYQILLGSKTIGNILDELGYRLENQNEVINFPDDGSEPLERGHVFSFVRKPKQG